MALKRLAFRSLYRFGYTPWDGHPIGQALRDLVEGTVDTPALPAGSALDLGCGTGDNSLYLAEHGWQVTGVDYVSQALDKARAKVAAAEAAVTLVQADVTRLSHTGIGADFRLIVDNGCLHNMSERDRDAYVSEVGAVAAPDARLLIVAFVPGGRFGVAGIEPAEMERRFASGWTMLSAGHEQDLDQARLARGRASRDTPPTRYYLYQRRPPVHQTRR